jgi:FkbM family methyltransferase
MSVHLVRQVHYENPFAVRSVPFLARFYRFAFQQRGSRKKELFLYVPLRRLFAHYLRFCRRPRWGTFDYQRLDTTCTVRCDTRNLQFHALFGWNYKQGYEPDVALLLDALLPEGGTFYDIGSNWGYFPLYAASRRRALAVHSFEPHPLTFQDLESCVEQAGLKGIVTCHNFALSSADGEAFIQFPDGLHSGWAEVSPAGGTRITTRRLDSLGLPPPDFVKIDVEGHEIEALRGAESTLRRAQPFVVFESKRDYGAPERTLEPLFFLANLGYRFFQPALERNRGERRYALPFGFQEGLGDMQPLEKSDLLALEELNTAERLLLRDDLNLLACHHDRMGALAAAFPGPG